jgi:hypothetical protein
MPLIPSKKFYASHDPYLSRPSIPTAQFYMQDFATLLWHLLLFKLFLKHETEWVKNLGQTSSTLCLKLFNGLPVPKKKCSNTHQGPLLLGLSYTFHVHVSLCKYKPQVLSTEMLTVTSRRVQRREETQIYWIFGGRWFYGLHPLPSQVRQVLYHWATFPSPPTLFKST